MGRMRCRQKTEFEDEGEGLEYDSVEQITVVEVNVAVTIIRDLTPEKNVRATRAGTKDCRLNIASRE